MMLADQKDRPPISGRRRVPRRAFEGNVGVLLAGIYGIERSYQVGEGGMMISCAQHKLNEGIQIVVNFFLPSGSLIMVRGVVRSVIESRDGLPERYGIEFVNVGFQSKREIRNFVAAATSGTAGSHF
jgi:PilZ domain